MLSCIMRLSEHLGGPPGSLPSPKIRFLPAGRPPGMEPHYPGTMDRDTVALSPVLHAWVWTDRRHGGLWPPLGTRRQGRGEPQVRGERVSLPPPGHGVTRDRVPGVGVTRKGGPRQGVTTDGTVQVTPGDSVTWVPGMG